MYFIKLVEEQMHGWMNKWQAGLPAKPVKAGPDQPLSPDVGSVFPNPALIITWAHTTYLSVC